MSIDSKTVHIFMDSLKKGVNLRPVLCVIETRIVFKKLTLVNNWSVLHKIYFVCK